ncbi:MAG TPA: DUF3107 domain-containing protein [Acidimicrobiales bacterium]|nr:DUF3107 domain-containing protein [Acidimicrobiales bacterium]
MDVRIGVTHAPREINIEIGDDTDRDSLKSKVDAALADDDAVLWLTDRRGRDIGIPSERIAYIEIGASNDDRKIGFGG